MGNYTNKSQETGRDLWTEDKAGRRIWKGSPTVRWQGEHVGVLGRFLFVFYSGAEATTSAEAAAPGCASGLQIPGRDPRPCGAGRVHLVNRNLSTRGKEKPERLQVPQADNDIVFVGRWRKACLRPGINL